MSVRPGPGAKVPDATVRAARASNPKGTAAMWIRDRLDGLWTDEDFTPWYPRDGRPGWSPAQLATVCVLQFVHGWSDRAAAEAVRCRIDVKYELGMDLDDPGFHQSLRTGELHARFEAAGTGNGASATAPVPDPTQLRPFEVPSPATD
ncbi:transposase [Streptomyces sp. H27-C3]|uniref:transposase n=1 Tax=Streptomyces sp. H27-C3 TaxID=3046305 RepID=UPI0024B9C6D9|nr:transposase [Streptomyces sp. H27-C3]MDJ0465904.1 transposase [Streptomyces sp. H27-C3]